MGELQEGNARGTDGPVERGPRPVDMGRLPNLIGYQLRRAQLAVYHDFERAFAELAIRPAQYAVLTIIERNPGLKQSEVGAALGIKRANFVTLCDELEARALVERRVQATDRRSYALHLTRKGKALITRMHEVNDAHEAKLVAEIGETGRDQLIAMLGRLRTVGDNDSDQTRPAS